jgi:hypothetical protein
MRVRIVGDLAITSMIRGVVCAVHESNRAESVMPGRLVTGPWILNPDTGVRIAPRAARFGNVSKGGGPREEKFEEW